MSTVIPTKSNLIAAQKSLKLAKLGYELLEQKKNILLRELSGLSGKETDLRKETNKAYKRAYTALKLANVTLGNCNSFAETVPEDKSVVFTSKSVMGMSIPDISHGESAFFSHFGFADTNGYLDIAKLAFDEAKEMTFRLASLEADKSRLLAAISKTSKRSNALCNVQIPKLAERIKLISEALDEKEREDFSRLKMIKKND